VTQPSDSGFEWRLDRNVSPPDAIMLLDKIGLGMTTTTEWGAILVGCYDTRDREHETPRIIAFFYDQDVREQLGAAFEKLGQQIRNGALPTVDVSHVEPN